MSRLIDSADSAMLRWSFPELDPPSGRAPPAAVPAALVEEGVAVASLAPDTDQPGPTAINQHAGEAPADNAFSHAHAEAIERGAAEGREQGFAEGYAAGLRQAEVAAAQDAQRLAAIIDRLGAPVTALERQVEEALVSLALEVARCVIGDEISRSRDYLVRLIREALAQAPVQAGGLHVLLNPDDLRVVRQSAPDIENSASLMADATVEPGGCLVVVDDDPPAKERRWQPRVADGASRIDLSLAARWREVMVAMFDGE